jgi:ribonuclease P protein component
MPDYRFTKAQRLLKPTDFDRVFARRRSQADRVLIVYACENDGEGPRLGLVVSRKVGPAVARNRWKRCLREAFRLAQHELPRGLDLVVMPRPDATPSTAVLQKSLRDLAGRLALQLGLANAPPAEEGPA